MNWVSKIDKIYCLNLPHRDDRLLAFTEMAEKYNFPFQRVTAIPDVANGARGLRDTMQQLFKKCIADGYQHVLIFEDDCEIIVEPWWFEDTMNNVMKQFPENYHMIFLGCQITGTVNGKISPNLVSASKMFSTHSVLYSLQGMKEIISNGFDFPIDNYYVEKIEPMQRSFCTYPLLTSQRAGYSDICKNEIDWSPFIVSRYAQKMAELK